MFTFIRFYFGFLILWLLLLLLLLYYSYLHLFTTCVLFHQSPAIIILYHVCSLLDIIYYSTPVCMCSRHSFQYMVMTWIYRFTCAYPCMPLGSASPLIGGVWLPWTCMFRSWSLDRSGLLGAQSCLVIASLISCWPSWALSFQAPWSSLEFFFCTVHNCLSLCILAFAPTGDVLFLKYCLHPVKTL